VASAGHPPLQQVHLEIGDPQHGHDGAEGRPTGERVEACEQLGERGRLHQIVVGARLQSRHPVADLAHGRQQQGGSPHPGRARRPHDSKPVEARQHAVDESTS
jgi:hypothetical protein